MNKSILSGSDKPSLRYAAVSMVLAKVSFGTSTSRAVSETLKCFSNEGVTNMSRSALYRWLKLYRAKGWSGLQQPTIAATRSALTEQFKDFLFLEKKKDPKASIPEVIRRAREAGIIGKGQLINRVTVYRYARFLNLPNLRQRKGEASTKRPFAYPHRMQMVLCDGKHFRAGAGRDKRVVFSFIDDSTRLILGVIVGTSENSLMFLRGLHDVITSYGLMDHLYLDKGTGFTADIVKRIAPRLNIPLIFGATRYPEGHGKIERYHRTLIADCLRGLAKPGIDPGLSALRVRIQHYVNEIYANSINKSLHETPFEKFSKDSRPLRFPDNQESFIDCFTVVDIRKVREDNVIPYNDVLYEVPLGYAGTRINVFFNSVTRNVSVMHQGSMIQIHPPDLAFNARERRVKTTALLEDHEPTITTAAEIRFNKDMQPIVDSHGGYSHDKEDKIYD